MCRRASIIDTDQASTFSMRTNVRLWHLADINSHAQQCLLSRVSGHPSSAADMSAFDPKRTSAHSKPPLLLRYRRGALVLAASIEAVVPHKFGRAALVSRC